MQVKQIATLVNEIAQEVIGESSVVQEDLTGIVDVGKAIFDNTAVDNYAKKLVDKIGRVIFWDRTYQSTAPDILRDAWEYGSVLEKVRCTMPEAEENDTWSLADGTSYDPFVFTAPGISAKFFNSKTTFEVPMSFTELQIKESVMSPEALNRFVAMIENRIRMKLTLSSDSMIMRAINNMIAEKIAAKNNVINLLSLYNNAKTTVLTPEQALLSPDFLRYAVEVILNYKKYITSPSMLFNNDGYVTFTPDDKQRLVMLQSFMTSVAVNMQSDTYHNDLVSISGYSTVPYWQGSGTSNMFEFSEVSQINVKTASSGTTVQQNGVVGVLFDIDGCMCCNENQRVTSIWNPKAEFWNYFYKFDASYINDLAENCIVFVIATEEEST